MMPVLGTPIVERVMDSLPSDEVDQFIVVASPSDAEIAPHFTSKSRYRDRVELVVQPSAGGMASAIGCAAPLIDREFILSACDNLIDEDEILRMIDNWNMSNSLNGLMALMPMGRDEVSRSGIVELDGHRVVRVVEKPSRQDASTNIASLPLYIFSPLLLNYLDSVPSSPREGPRLQDAIQALISAKNGVVGHQVRSRMDPTTTDDLLSMKLRYLTDNVIGTTDVGPGNEFVSPVHIEQLISIGDKCVIGPNVYAESGFRVGDGVTLCDSVVLREAAVRDGSTIIAEFVSN